MRRPTYRMVVDLIDLLDTDVGNVRALEAHGRALALLGGEEGGGDDGR